MIFFIHEWMSSESEMFLLFRFVVMSLLSSWDEIDFCVELLADDVWSDQEKTGSLSVAVDCFELIVFEITTNFLGHGVN